MIFEEGGIIEIIHSCFKIIFEEGGIIEIISTYICTFVYLIKPKRCDRISFINERCNRMYLERQERQMYGGGPSRITTGLINMLETHLS